MQWSTDVFTLYLRHVYLNVVNITTMTAAHTSLMVHLHRVCRFYTSHSLFMQSCNAFWSCRKLLICIKFRSWLLNANQGRLARLAACGNSWRSTKLIIVEFDLATAWLISAKMSSEIHFSSLFFSNIKFRNELQCWSGFKSLSRQQARWFHPIRFSCEC